MPKKIIRECVAQDIGWELQGDLVDVVKGLQTYLDNPKYFKYELKIDPCDEARWISIYGTRIETEKERVRRLNKKRKDSEKRLITKQKRLEKLRKEVGKLEEELT